MTTGPFLWPIDEAQSSRLSNLLGVDFERFGIAGHWLNRPELTCHTCGKVSGLDDFVGTALNLHIHDREFLIQALEGDKENLTPAHQLQCCGCGNTFLENKPVEGEEPRAAMVWWYPKQGIIWREMRN